MEKYFIVTEKSKLNKHYWDYVNNVTVINDLVKEFMPQQGMETHEYYATTETFYIVPTEKDIEKFDKVLNKPINDGLRQFKKNSKIGKAWVKLLDEKGLKVLSKPFVPFYFNNAYGRNTTRLFHIKETIYCSFRSDYGNIDNPEGMIEIKASEFYKAIEDENDTSKL